MSQIPTIPTLTLNDGIEIPQIGFGVFQVPPEQTQRAVEQALEAGYRHIDTAAAYRNEEGVGAALRSAGLPREEVFITTKLRNGEQPEARRALEASLTALGLDQVDLYLIHWPVPSQNAYIDAWKALEQAQQEGLSRSIGVSNFLPEHLQNLLGETTVVPSVNQIELHPTFQQPATAQATREAGIAVEAYSPIGQGKDLTNDTVVEIAEQHGATPAQVVLAWHLAQGTIVIPKTQHPERMSENLAAATLTLNDDDITRISALNTDVRVGADPATADFTQL